MSAPVKGKKRRKPAPFYLSLLEAKSLMDEAASHKDPSIGLRNSAMIHLGLSSLRVSEILNMAAEEIDLGGGDEKPHLWVRGGKGGKDRKIPLSAACVDTLRKYLSRLGSMQTFGPLFDMSVRNFQLNIKSIAERAGIRKFADVTPHVLRHTFTVACYKKNMRLRTLQRLLGHSSLAITEKYLLLMVQDHEDEIDRVGGLPF